jgi:hypothetical protein
MQHGLNLSVIDPTLKSHALQAFDKGDALGFVCAAGSGDVMALVFDNLSPLKDRGLYEAAILHAFTAPRINHRGWSTSVIEFMFSQADRDKLRAAGRPLPGEGPFTVYRGVAGTGRARRLRGFSWTSSLNLACWFATRFDLKNPTVIQAEVTAGEVLAYCEDTVESEFICRPNAVERCKITDEELRKRSARCAEKMRAEQLDPLKRLALE